jgi:hypothetical protein
MLEVQAEHVKLRQRFEALIRSHFGLDKFPTKAERWWDLGLSDVVRAIKPKMTISDRDELLTLMQTYADRVRAQVQEIQSLEQSIDSSVYSLFGLDSEEISIIESRIN